VIRTAPIVLFVLLAFGCAGAGAAPAPRPAGTWAGTFSFARGGETVSISVELAGRTATVALGAGHPARTVVPVRTGPGRLRLSLPGRPARVLVDARLRGGRLVGTIRQGTIRGTVSLRRGRPVAGASAGLYALPDGRGLGVLDGFYGRAAVDFDRDEIRGLYPTGAGRYAVGSGLATRNPVVGTAAFAGEHVLWLDVRAERVPLRQEEVRVGVLSCTLTIPPGEGRRAAVAFAHGAGPAPRAWTSTQALFLNRLGLITLACDKRGVGQSGGRYPGEFPSNEAVDRYARDVEAQARFLASQPEVDPARVGVMGASQAGWIMPIAAVREPAIRFVVGLVAPTLSQGETDLWADLSGKGVAPPVLTDAEIEARVRSAGPRGVDPRSAIRELRIPVVWLYGGKDRTVPTRLCVEWLDPLTREAGRDFSYAVFPGGGHSLIETPNGLADETLRSHRFVPGYHATIRDWLRARGFAS
jgi:uncharacterized protein